MLLSRWSNVHWDVGGQTRLLAMLRSCLAIVWPRSLITASTREHLYLAETQLVEREALQSSTSCRYRCLVTPSLCMHINHWKRSFDFHSLVLPMCLKTDRHEPSRAQTVAVGLH